MNKYKLPPNSANVTGSLSILNGGTGKGYAVELVAHPYVDYSDEIKQMRVGLLILFILFIFITVKTWRC